MTRSPHEIAELIRNVNPRDASFAALAILAGECSTMIPALAAAACDATIAAGVAEVRSSLPVPDGTLATAIPTAPPSLADPRPTFENANAHTAWQVLRGRDRTAADLTRALGHPWTRSQVDFALSSLKRSRLAHTTHNPRGGMEHWHARTLAEAMEAIVRLRLRAALRAHESEHDPDFCDRMIDAFDLLPKLLRLPDAERLAIAALAEQRCRLFDEAWSEGAARRPSVPISITARVVAAHTCEVPPSATHVGHVLSILTLDGGMMIVLDPSDHDQIYANAIELRRSYGARLGDLAWDAETLSAYADGYVLDPALPVIGKVV